MDYCQLCRRGRGEKAGCWDAESMGQHGAAPLGQVKGDNRGMGRQRRQSVNAVTHGTASHSWGMSHYEQLRGW